MLEVAVLLKDGVGTEDTRRFEAKYGHTETFVLKHETICRAYTQIDDIEKLKEIDDLLDGNVELKTAAGLKKVLISFEGMRFMNL